MAIHFSGPCTMKCGKYIITPVKIQLHAHHTEKSYRLLTAVDQSGASCNHIICRIYIIMQLQFHRISAVPQCHTQMLHFRFRTIRTRKRAILRLSGCDLGPRKHKIRSRTAIRMDDFQKRLSDISFSISRQFQTDIFQRNLRKLWAVNARIPRSKHPLFPNRSDRIRIESQSSSII